MSDFKTVQGFIDKVNSSKNFDEIQKEFQRIIKEMGFNTFSCVSYVDFNDPPKGAITIVEYPEIFFERYKEQRYDQHDRILKIALNKFTPFVWTSEIVQRGMNKRQKEIFDDAASVNMIQGITVPIHMRGAFPGSVNVVGENKDINPDCINAIHLMGIYLHDSAIKFFKENLKEAGHVGDFLTESERECLRWVAIGKTDRDIGKILKKSQRTVHHQIENAKKKLNASTRVQAVVTAYLQNQINP